jgi:hypothetical protein
MTHSHAVLWASSAFTKPWLSDPNQFGRKTQYKSFEQVIPDQLALHFFANKCFWE